MGIFGGFRATFNKDSSQKKKKKDEVGVVVCTSYRVFSEFSDEQYALPTSYKPIPSTSGTQPYASRLKSRAPISKTPSSSSTLQDESELDMSAIRNPTNNTSVSQIEAKSQYDLSKTLSSSSLSQDDSQFEMVTIKTTPDKSAARKIKAKSQYDMSTFKNGNAGNERIKSAEIVNYYAPPHQPAESKPTPKARKSVENVVQDEKCDIRNGLVTAQNSEEGIGLKDEEEYYFIIKQAHLEGIYSEPAYNNSETVEVTALQMNDGVVLQSKTKKVRKEKGKKREAKVLVKTPLLTDEKKTETSTMNKARMEHVTISSNYQTITKQSVEFNSETSTKSETQIKNDYGSYFNQKATSLGYSTSEAASIFFQDDEEDDTHQIIQQNHEDASNKGSWKGVSVLENTDDDETRRISSVEC